jgi:RNA polymerase sigma factor (sigma-70 family)
MDKDKLFEEVYTKYQRFPYFHFYKYFGYNRAHNAEELVADFWASFYESIGAFRAENGAKITTFMFSCCKHFMSNAKTKENADKRKATLLSFQSSEMTFRKIIDGKAGPLRALISKETKAVVDKALAELTDEQYTFISEVLIKGERLKDTHVKLGMKYSVAKHRWAKAQMRFANLTRRYYVSEG